MHLSIELTRTLCIYFSTYKTLMKPKPFHSDKLKIKNEKKNLAPYWLLRLYAR